MALVPNLPTNPFRAMFDQARIYDQLLMAERVMLGLTVVARSQPAHPVVWLSLSAEPKTGWARLLTAFLRPKAVVEGRRHVIVRRGMVLRLGRYLTVSSL